MGYDDNPYLDEDGEPLMDPDAGSDPDQSPTARYDDEGLEDDVEWGRGMSPSPSPARPRKRTLLKGGKSQVEEAAPLDGEGLEDWEDEQPSSSAAKRSKALSKSAFREGGKGSGKEVEKKKKKQKVDRDRVGKGGGSSSRDPEGESEIQELWDTIAGEGSEDDREGIRTADDDAFIDDTGVDPADRFGSDNEGARFAYDAPQAEEGEEDDEINQMFKGGKKKKKNEKSPAEIALIVEHLMAELEVTAEADAELNRQSMPAINKLKKLPLLTQVLSKKSLQQEFLDHGVLVVLKNWLEPLPDGSLPNMNVRSAILKILADFPIDLEQNDRREQLKKSGLGKVIMFLSKSDEETTANRKLAKDLVDKWSRPIFNKSTRFEDMRGFDDDRVPYRRPTLKKPASKASGLDSRDVDLDEFSQGPKSGQSASRQHASVPEAAPLDFVVRPRSKIDPDEIRARAKQQYQDQRRLQMNKKLQRLKASRKKQLQAAKVSAEGRNMVKYL